MKLKKTVCFTLAGMFCLSSRAGAMLALGGPLGSNMVIQQNKPFCIWGHGDAGVSVRVRGDWMEGVVQVEADAQGNFMGIIPVPPVQPGDYRAHVLTVESGVDKVVLENLLIGEVWFCSGQSNMQFGMKDVLDSTAEIAAAQHPGMRLFNAALNFSARPLDSVRGRWQECTPETVKGFSAVAYYFGRALQQRLNLPVGLIFSGIGAAAAQAYVPEPLLAADSLLDSAYLRPYLNSPRSKEQIDAGFSFEKVTRPFLLYNALIYPFRHLSIRGFCWYQGESNRRERAPYTWLMQTLISGWRQAFGQGELPFFYVQIAPFAYDKEGPSMADDAFFREAQTRISGLGNTAMVITMDVGDVNNLHPKNKKPVGERLGRTALNRVYGQLDVAWQGPVYQGMEVKGHRVRVLFEPGTVAGGLRTRDGKAPAYFSLAGKDHVFHPAEAEIRGDAVVLKAAGVKHPLAVRYAFTNYPITNFENGEGLPAVPFRTDDWPENK